MTALIASLSQEAWQEVALINYQSAIAPPSFISLFSPLRLDFLSGEHSHSLNAAYSAVNGHGKVTALRSLALGGFCCLIRL